MAEIEYGHTPADGGRVIPLTETSVKWHTVTPASLRVRPFYPDPSPPAPWRLPTEAEAMAYFGGSEPPGPDEPGSEPQSPPPPPVVTVTRELAIRRAAAAVLGLEWLAEHGPAMDPQGIATTLQAAQIWATLAVAFIDGAERYVIDVADPTTAGHPDVA